MSSSVKREKQLARERYERQQARRRQQSMRRRKRQQIVAAAVAVVLVVGGVIGIALAVGGDDEGTVATRSKASTSATPSPSAEQDASSPAASPEATPAGQGCTFTETGDAAKDVGVPSYDKAAAAKPATATLATNRGDIVIDLATKQAPCTTTSFRHLAENEYFDQTSCHRLTTENIFVLQCGDPTGNGSGGPGYQFGVENAPADQTYPPGTVAMARTPDPGSNGSQFFLVYEETTLPDENGYSIFGRVTEGLDVLKQVAEAGVEGGATDGAPAEPVTLETVRIGKGERD